VLVYVCARVCVMRACACVYLRACVRDVYVYIHILVHINNAHTNTPKHFLSIHQKVGRQGRKEAKFWGRIEYTQKTLSIPHTVPFLRCCA